MSFSNEERAQRARNAMDAYMAENGTDSRDAVITDILADMLHMCAIDCEMPNFDDCLRRARMHFEAESRGES